jgi:hypothetical protein
MTVGSWHGTEELALQRHGVRRQSLESDLLVEDGNRHDSGSTPAPGNAFFGDPASATEQDVIEGSQSRPASVVLVVLRFLEKQRSKVSRGGDIDTSAISSRLRRCFHDSLLDCRDSSDKRRRKCEAGVSHVGTASLVLMHPAARCDLVLVGLPRAT